MDLANFSQLYLNYLRNIHYRDQREILLGVLPMHFLFYNHDVVCHRPTYLPVLLLFSPTAGQFESRVRPAGQRGSAGDMTSVPT